MIIIDKQTRGRHGNKVFHFNTLMQISQITGQQVFTDCWDGYGHFNETCRIANWVSGDIQEIPFSDLIYKSKDELSKEYSTGNWKLHTLSLCGPFFRITHVDPREFISLKTVPSLEPQAIGVHVRGGDTRGADGMNCREVHPPEYYINAIDFVLDEYSDPHFYFCTDDPDSNYPSYQKTLSYLKDKKVQLTHNPNASYMHDFSLLSECDVLISGSSTFSLAAGMIGKKKKIIHSRDFVEQFKEEDQKWYSKFGNGMFFHDMNHMTSNYYNLWRLI
tara:strand:- start:2585 stop:3409 length:825 start_codon:yes stop_codon:yes gene_type:complete